MRSDERHEQQSEREREICADEDEKEGRGGGGGRERRGGEVRSTCSQRAVHVLRVCVALKT